MVLPLRLVQTLWIFPLSGIGNKSHKYLSVKVCSWKTFYAVSCAILQVNYFIFYCTRLIYFVPDVAIRISVLITATEAILQVFNFWYLTVSWRKLVRQWEDMEKSMRYHESPSMNVERSVKLTIIILLILLMVEYPAVITQTNITHYSDGKSYCTASLFKLLCFIALLQKVFIWFFRDALIIIISICFRCRLRQIQERIWFLIRMKVDNLQIWHDAREDYSKVLGLCRTINHTFFWLVMISYIGNIAYLLVNVFSIMAYESHTVFTKSVQFYRISLMILRVILVSLVGGCLHEENERIVDLLLSVPSSVYNVQVKRFLYAASSKRMTLTGRNLFNISRSLILRVANSIITYELIIMQFVYNFRQLE